VKHSSAGTNIAIFIDDLPVEQNYFVDLTIGRARYQLDGMSERLGEAGICDGFMAAPTAPF
jgi:hypothetical protein